jgi:anti-sigma factor RsiW
MRFCEPMARSILASVDGTLPPAEQERFARHLASCPGCREAVAEHAAVKARLGELPFARVSSAFTERLMRRLAEPAWLDIANWRVWTLRLAPIAALLALLASLSPSAGTSSPDSLPAVLESWATVEEDVQMRRLLNPAVGPNALLHPAMEDPAQ